MRFFSNNHKSGSWDLGGGEPAALDCDSFSAEFRDPKELSLSGREQRKIYLFPVLNSRTVLKEKKPVIHYATLGCYMFVCLETWRTRCCVTFRIKI